MAQQTPTWTWTGEGADSDWMNADNWSGLWFQTPLDGVPADGDIVHIRNFVTGGMAELGNSQTANVSIFNVAPTTAPAQGGQFRLHDNATLAVSGAVILGQGNHGDEVGRLFVSEAILTVGGNITIGSSNAVGELNISDGGLVQIGGSVVLGGNANSTGTAGTGVLRIGDGDDDQGGQLDVTAVSVSGSGTGGQGELIFHHGNSSLEFGANVGMLGSNAGSRLTVTHNGPGLTRMTGNLNYRGDTNINAGTLVLGGGSMNLDGNVNVGAGTLALGVTSEGNRGVRTLNITGDLLMMADSTLHMGLGQAVAEGGGDEFGLGDFISVGGDLTLAGSLNISNLGGMGDGTYALFEFGASGSGSAIGEFSEIDFLGSDFSGSIEIDNSTRLVLLTIGAELGEILYWAGGDGDWDNATSNWTNQDATASGAWQGGVATFRTSEELNIAAGDITVTDTVAFTRLDFLNNGFTIGSDGEADSYLEASVSEDTSTAVLNVVNNVTATITAGITGEANIRKIGGGTLVLAGDNGWEGTTTVSAGVLQLGAGGTSGNLPGDVLIEGEQTAVAFNRSDRVEYGGSLSGDGQLHQLGGIDGTGTLVLTGTNSYRQTQVLGGTLEVAEGGTLGGGAVTIASGGTLALSRSGNWSFDNTITGSGTLAQRGGGIVTLTGTLSGFTGSLLAESGRINLGPDSNFGGSVTVDDTLVVNGTVGGAVNVRTGGTVSGTGSVGSLSVGNGGTVSPGNSIGTLTVTGNASFAANSVFEVEANNAGAADRINVGGALNISGGTVQVLASPNQSAAWRPFTEYAILTHGGSRLGEFAEVDTDLAFLDPRLEYRPGMVVLHLDRSDIAFADVAITPNQRQAAAALEALGLTHRVAGEVVPLYDQVVGGTSTDAILAFDAVSGELHASMAGMLLDDSRLVRDALLGRAALTAGRSTATQVWARALTHRGESKGSGVHDFERDAQGLLVGADHVLGDGQYGFGWTAGHHRNGEAEIKTLRSQGEVKSTHVGAYLGSRAEGLGIRGGLAHSWHEVDTERTVAFTGFNEYVTANYKARTTQLFAEVDYEVEVAGQSIAPFLSVAWARLQANRFMEADFLSPIGSTAGLRAGSQKHNATFATLGARADLELGERLLVDGMLGYRRTLSGDEPSLRMGFVDGAQGFTIHGVPLARDAMVADIGLALRLGENIRIGAAYNGLLGSDVRDHAVEARLSIALQ